MSSPDEAYVEVRDLHFSYGKLEALKGLSFKAPRAKITGLLGPNGSGKSTSFKILSTQLALTRGSAEIDGHSLSSQQRRIRSLLGVTFQSPSLDPMLTVRENLVIHAKLMGLDSSQRKFRIDEVLGKMNLQDRASSRVKELSGGLARRVELAKTLLSEPKLLLLDEPTTGLDPKARSDFWIELRRLQKLGLSILVTTHLMEEAELCDELRFINDGRLAASGSPAELRAEFGAEILWVEIPKPEAKVGELKAALGPSDRIEVRGDKIRVETPQPLVALDKVRALWPTELRGLVWSKANLGDIYLSKTGKTLAP